MQIRSNFPHTIDEVAHLWIPLADGTRLAARLWLPAHALDTPAPAILEYIPYRKNDATASRDALHHPYFAGCGYAALRVDLRGSGESDGILYDEYLQQEQDDALEVLSWLAAQPWCNGKVGIIGKSWGGFNGLQIAARRPPELRAVITVCSTDDRYADDVHYLGGCMLGSEMLSWASIMLANNARPPDPRHVGEEWRQIWMERMEKSPPYVETWVAHQRRDAYWRHGSVCEAYAAIEVPVYAVGGWADGYTNAILRLMAGLSCPRKALIGPWAHLYPMSGVPGPAIGFNQECVRWWDHWLKGIDTGLLDEPMIRAWVQEPVKPAAYYPQRPGHWVSDVAWPSRLNETLRFYLNARTLDRDGGQPAQLRVGSVQTHGVDSGAWCAYGRQGDLPPDQRAEDGKSLCFDSNTLQDPLEIFGFPELTLTLSADQPLALVAVRLCDVAPDGTSLLVSRGLLNLTHRASHAEPSALTRGEEYTVTFKLDACGHRAPAGHRLRLAVAPTYWPFAWPSPTPVELTVQTGSNSHLDLPIRPPVKAAESMQPFGLPESSQPLPLTRLRTGCVARTHAVDVVTGRHTISVTGDEGRVRFDTHDNLEYASRIVDMLSIVEGDPLSAEARCLRTIELARDEWQIRIETDSVMTADATHFHLSNALDAFEGNSRVFTKRWNQSIERDLC